MDHELAKQYKTQVVINGIDLDWQLFTALFIIYHNNNINLEFHTFTAKSVDDAKKMVISDSDRQTSQEDLSKSQHGPIGRK